MSYVERLSEGLKASLAGQVVSTVSNVVLIIVLTRYLLQPSEFGLLQFALSVLTVMAIFASLGLPKSAARYVTEYVERDPTQVRYILRRSALYIAALSSVVGVVLVVASESLTVLLDEPRLTPFLIVGGAYVMLYAFNGYLVTIFQAFNRVTWSALLNSLSSLGRTVFAVAFVVLGFGALGVLIGYVAGFVLSVMVGAFVLYTRYYTEFTGAEQPDSDLSKRIVRYSIPLTATKAAGVLDKRVDSILVGILLNPTAVGFYVLARQVTDVVAVPAGSFGFTLSPTIGEQKAQEQLSTARALYEKALTYTLLFYIPSAVGIMLLSEPLIRIVFGSDYLDAAPVLTVIAPVVVVHAVNQITSDGLDYLGRARTRAIAKSAMAVANFGLNLILIPPLGVVGAAVATVVTYATYTLVNVYTIHEELSLDVGRILWNATTICAISAAMAGAVLFVLPYVSGVVSLLAVILLGGGVWVVLSVLSGLFDVKQVVSFLA